MRLPCSPWKALSVSSTSRARRGASNATCCPYPDGLQGALLCSRTFTPGASARALLRLRLPRDEAAVGAQRGAPGADGDDRDVAHVALARDRHGQLGADLQGALEALDVRGAAGRDR